MSRPSRRAGFTLIEVMVVVIVIAVFAGVAAPLLGERRAGAELADAARALAQTAQLARQEAVRSGADVRWVLGRDGPDGWSLETANPEAPDGPPRSVRRGSLGAGTLPAGVVFLGVEVRARDAEAATDQVVFEGRGGATPAVIRLANEAGERAVLVFASGRVMISREAAGPPAGRVDLDLGR